MNEVAWEVACFAHYENLARANGGMCRINDVDVETCVRAHKGGWREYHADGRITVVSDEQMADRERRLAEAYRAVTA